MSDLGPRDSCETGIERGIYAKYYRRFPTCIQPYGPDFLRSCSYAWVSELYSQRFNYPGLFNCDFTGCDLSNARFDNAFLTACDFSGANLSTVFWDADNLKKNIFDQDTRFPRSYTPKPSQMRAKR